jgi:hypothetical protein
VSLPHSRLFSPSCASFSLGTAFSCSPSSSSLQTGRKERKGAAPPHVVHAAPSSLAVEDLVEIKEGRKGEGGRGYLKVLA